MIKLKSNLNLIPGRIPQRIKVNQFDHDVNALEFTLYNGASAFSIPSGASVTIQGEKPDRKGFQYAAKFSGSVVTADLTEQMTAVHGDVTTELVIEDSNKNKIATANFIVVVEPAAMGDDVVVSESDLPLLEKVANNAELIKSYKNAAENANEQAQTARTGAETAQTAAETAKADAQTAQRKVEAAQAAAESAKADAETAESNAQRHANNASESAAAAGTSEQNAQTYADKSQSYAVGTDGEVRENDAIDNAKNYYEQAKYYYEQAKSISETLSGILQPKGTITFAELPGLLDAEDGWMYNISDAFTTDARFKEGSGVSVAAGSNVYKTVDNQWDILAGSPVTRVAGKTGDVTLDKSDVGLGNVEDKSSATIRSEITSQNVINALGYTPPRQDTTYYLADEEDPGLIPRLNSEPSVQILKFLRGDNTWQDLSGAVKDLGRQETVTDPDDFHPDYLAYAIFNDEDNNPTDSDGVGLWIPYSSIFGQQFFFNDDGYQILHRYLSSNKWSAWKRIYDDEYHPNPNITTLNRTKYVDDCDDFKGNGLMFGDVDSDSNENPLTMYSDLDGAGIILWIGFTTSIGTFGKQFVSNIWEDDDSAQLILHRTHAKDTWTGWYRVDQTALF